MRLSFNFKNMDSSEALKDYAAKRFDKLSKYFDGIDAELYVTMSLEKTGHIADIVFDADNIHIQAHERGEDMYASLDLVSDKLESQLKRMRERAKDRRKTAQARTDVVNFAEDKAGTKTRSIVESKEFDPKPMTVDEAAEQLLATGKEFVVFYNADIDRVNIIHKLKSGDFAVIDPATGSY